MTNDRMARFRDSYVGEKVTCKRVVLLALSTIAGSVWWQVKRHLSVQQLAFCSAYAKARIGLFIGLDPLGSGRISFPDGDLSLLRFQVVQVPAIIDAWHQFWAAVEHGTAIAVIGMAVIVLLLGAVDYVADLARPAAPSLSAHEPTKAPSAAPSAAPAAPISTPLPVLVETSPEAEPVPAGEPIEDAIEEELAPQPQDPQPSANVIPIRQPGRIYRGPDR
jgi:hypothetical protein